MEGKKSVEAFKKFFLILIFFCPEIVPKAVAGSSVGPCTCSRRKHRRVTLLLVLLRVFPTAVLNTPGYTIDILLQSTLVYLVPATVSKMATDKKEKMERE